jgi:hypothetical protein
MLLSQEDYRAALSQVFRVQEAPDMTLALTQVEPLAMSQRNGGGFRLEFTGPTDPALPQGLYLLESVQSQAEIFIVPVARDAATLTYEAIFN